MFIDTHTHLDFNKYDKDREVVIQRAIKNNIMAIITIGTDIPSSEKAIELAEKYATVFAAVGIHPSDCTNTTYKDLERIESLCSHEKVIAIGEVGLDYYHMNASKSQQWEVLLKQIELAVKLNKPLIIHNRESHNDIYDIIATSNAAKVGGVFHSFSGDLDFLDKILSINFHISFTGNITFKKSNKDSLVKEVPVNQLLLETDSPFLAPTPMRGKRNEPAFLVHTAERIARIKELPVKEVGRITSENAKNLFNLAI